MENEDEEAENGDDNDDFINDILTSDDEEKEKISTRKTKLVPIDAIDDVEQETLRSLSFNERTKRTKNSSAVPTSRSNQIPTDNDNNNNRRKTTDDHRKNVRRAPRGRMNSRRSET
jgi:hypothetical protein